MDSLAAIFGKNEVSSEIKEQLKKAQNRFWCEGTPEGDWLWIRILLIGRLKEERCFFSETALPAEIFLMIFRNCQPDWKKYRLLTLRQDPYIHHFVNEELAKNFLDNQKVLCIRAFRYFEKLNREKGFECLRKCIMLCPKSQFGYIARASVFTELQDLPKAEIEVKKGLKRFPKSAELFFQMSFCVEGDFEKLDFYRKALEFGFELPFLIYGNMGNLIKPQNEEKALEYFTKAADQGCIRGLTLRGMIYTERIEDEESMKKGFQDYQTALEKGGEQYAVLFNQIQQYYLYVGESVDGLLEKMMELQNKYPKSPHPYIWVGLLQSHVKKKPLRECIAEFDKGIKMCEPWYQPLLFLNKARLLLVANQVEEATACLQECLKVDPDNAIVTSRIEKIKLGNYFD